MGGDRTDFRNALGVTATLWACSYFLLLLPLLVTNPSMNASNYLLPTGVSLIGFLLTGLVYAVARRAGGWPMRRMIAAVAIAALAAAALLAVLDAWLHGLAVRAFAPGLHAKLNLVNMAAMNFIGFSWLYGMLAAIYVMQITGSAMRERERELAAAALQGAQKMQARQALLLALADRTRSLADPAAILAATAEMLGQQLSVARVTYSEVDSAGGFINNAHTWGDDRAAVAGTYPISILGEQVLAEHLSGRVFASNDTASDPRLEPQTKAVCAASKSASILTAPLVKEGQLVALLSMQHDRPRRWTDDDIWLVSEVAERTWANLARAYTADRLAEREASSAFLLELGDRLRERSAAAEMLREAVEAIGRRLGANRVGYAETDAAAGILAVDIEWGDGALPAIAGRYPLAAFGQFHLAALVRGETARIEDVESSPHIGDDNRNAIEAMGIRAAISVPLVRDGGLAALLSVHHGSARAWTDAEVHLVEEVAERTWAVVERARAEAELAASREALHQSEKLTALGSLLAGVSHELNNPLSVVVAQSVMMEEDAEGTKLASRAGKIRSAAERCAKIVATFLALARQKPPERRRVDVNMVVRGALELTAYGLRSTGVEVECDLGDDLPMLEADADQLHQVFANLFVNAQQALQEVDRRRRLTVITRLGRAPGTVEVDVADNGPGIPEDIRRRVLEPFFTTKPQGAGTGLGLSYSNGVVEAHGGTLDLIETSEGATFRVTLPARLSAEAPAALAPQIVKAGAARGHALVVDDEADIADTLAELLEAQGFRVRIAGNGAEAKRQLASQDFDLILSDLRMPDIDGPALYAWIAAERPHLRDRIGFVTGDTMGPNAVRFLATTGRPSLEKPFTPHGLRDFVGRVRAGAVPA